MDVPLPMCEQRLALLCCMGHSTVLSLELSQTPACHLQIFQGLSGRWMCNVLFAPSTASEVMDKVTL